MLTILHVSVVQRSNIKLKGLQMPLTLSLLVPPTGDTHWQPATALAISDADGAVADGTGLPFGEAQRGPVGVASGTAGAGARS